MSRHAQGGVGNLGARHEGCLLDTSRGVKETGVGLFFDVPQRSWFVGAGALLTLLGFSSVSPVLGRPVIWGLGLGYRAWGAVGRLAELNAVRNPRRTAATASALMIGLSFVTTMSILAASAKATSDGAIHRSMTADYTCLLYTSRCV